MPQPSVCLHSTPINLFRNFNPLRHNRFDIENRLQEILHNLILSLLACLLDLLHLVLCILVCVFFGLLVSAGMLKQQFSQDALICSFLQVCQHVERRGDRTSDSNFLNSSSFDLRYSSISFLASSRASLTRFVRSVKHEISSSSFPVPPHPRIQVLQRQSGGNAHIL